MKCSAETGGGQLPTLYQLTWQKRLGRNSIPILSKYCPAWQLSSDHVQVIITRKWEKKIVRGIKDLPIDRLWRNAPMTVICVCTSSCSPNYHPKSLLKLMKMGAALYSYKECTVHYSSEKHVNGLSLENELLLREHTY